MISAAKHSFFRFRLTNHYWNFPKYLPFYWFWLLIVKYRQYKISWMYRDMYAGKMYRKDLPGTFKTWLEAVAGDEKRKPIPTVADFEKVVNKQYYDAKDKVEARQRKLNQDLKDAKTRQIKQQIKRNHKQTVERENSSKKLRKRKKK